MAAAELPAPAGPPVSSPLAKAPAGMVERIYPNEPILSVTGPRLVGGELTNGKRSVRTGRDPIAVAMLDRGKKIAVLTGRARTLELYDAATLERVGEADAGIGPTALTTDEVEILYVTDVKGEALLVYHLRPRFELIRRVHVGGGPYAIAYDKERWGLWMALPRVNKLVHYAAGSRPIWRETFPMIRDAREVYVDGEDIEVRSEREAQVVRPRSR